MGNDWIEIADGMPGINKVVEVQDIRGNGGHGVLRLEGDTRHGAQDSRFVFGSPENHLLYNVKAWRPLLVSAEILSDPPLQQLVEGLSLQD